MRSYRTLLGQRDGTKRDLPLTPEEALDLREAGFQFSEFREDTGRYRLSMPFTVAIDLVHGVITFSQ